MKPLLIGMNNPHSTDPDFDLFPRPAGVAGHRLWCMMAEAADGYFPTWEYVKAFDRVNLVRGEWSRPAATLKAGTMLANGVGLNRPVVLLGNEVVLAFKRGGMNLEDVALFKWVGPSKAFPWRVAHIPHPSGRSHTWNDPVVRQRAAVFLKDLVKQARASVTGDPT